MKIMNRATRISVATIGVMLGIAGLSHGFFEILQGSTPTTGLIIQAIGPAQQMWYYGTEEAFTLIPNFLITGIAAVTVSLALIVWSAGFLHTKRGATVFGLLNILLFLVGGGIAAQMTFAPLTWAAATRLHSPLKGWRKMLPHSARPALGAFWPFTLVLGSISFQSDPEVILNICWAFIFLGGLGLYLLTFVSGFAYDIERQPGKAEPFS